MRFCSLLCVAVSALIPFLSAEPARASDYTAAEMTNKARSMMQQGTVSAYEEAFNMLYDAWNEADTDQVQSIILRNLQDALKGLNDAVKSTYPPFLDKPHEDDVSLYKRLVGCGDVRGMRLYGEYLWNEDRSLAAEYLLKAAHGGDGRACYLVARLCLVGGGGLSCNAENARGWLKASADAGYAPAWEKMAEIYWDGDGNWKTPQDKTAAMNYLGSARALYEKWKLSDAETAARFQEYCRSLVHIGNLMAAFRSRETGSLLPGFCPSFLALRLSFYRETDEGLRARLYYINEYMQRFPATYQLENLQKMNLAYLPIQIAKLDDNVLGTQKSWYEDNAALHHRIRIHVEAMPSLQNVLGEYRERAYWCREMKLNGTIAHELAHAYLATEYAPNYANKEYGKPLIEGHALMAEYGFLRMTYYGTRMAPELMASRESSEYAGYFQWYRTHCMNADDCADWEMVEYYAEQSGGGKDSRRQEQGRYGCQYEPTFFGPSFLGYL